MQGQVFKDAYFSINSVDLSDHVQQLQLQYQADAVEDTAMGDDTHSQLGGLKNWNVSVDLFQDYASGKVDDTLFALVGTTVDIEIRPTSAVVGASNPSYTGTVLVTSYEPASGQVGQALMAKLSLQAASTLSRATS